MILFCNIWTSWSWIPQRSGKYSQLCSAAPGPGTLYTESSGHKSSDRSPMVKTVHRTTSATNCLLMQNIGSHLVMGCRGRRDGGQPVTECTRKSKVAQYQKRVTKPAARDQVLNPRRLVCYLIQWSLGSN